MSASGLALANAVGREIIDPPRECGVHRAATRLRGLQGKVETYTLEYAETETGFREPSASWPHAYASAPRALIC